MNAVLEDARIAVTPASQDDPARDRRLLAWGLGLVLAVGVLWRVGRYLAGFPVWGDEAFILLNLVDLDYQGLASGLKYAQVAPLLFLWIEKAALDLLGPSELALRLAPLLAGIGGLLLFWRLCRQALRPLAAALAVGVLAVSYFPVRHACEVKPYAFDLCGAVVLLWAAQRWLAAPARLGRLWLLVLLVPFVLVSSYPAVFVAGAVALVLLPTAWRAGKAARGLFVVYGVLLVVTFAGHYLLVGRKQASPEQARRVQDFMRDYWQEAFPPPEVWRWPAWLLDVHTGNLLAYPAGAKHGASTVSFLLCALGAATLAWRRRWGLLALCLLPFALTLLAAALGRYPYGGSARIAQHLAAPICLLMGVGLASLVERLRSPSRWGFGISAGLALAGVVGLVYDGVHPYKTVHDFEVRRFARALGERLGPDDTVFVANDADSVAVEMRWYLGQNRAALQWLDRDGPPDATAQRVWLLYFSETPAEALIVVRRLCPGRYDDCTATEQHRDFLPAENNVAPAWHAIWQRLGLRSRRLE